MSGSSLRAVKWLFVLCNVLFLLMGVAMLVVGAYLQISNASYMKLVPSDDFFTATALMIASGTIVIVVCLFGFAGVLMESQCFLGIYFLCVLVIFALEIAAGVIGYIYYNEEDAKLRSRLLEGLRDPEKRKYWDDVQSAERCCGVTNYTDWYRIADADYPSAVPDSCCDGPVCGLQGYKVAYDEGCYDKGKDWLRDKFFLLGLSAIILGVLQIICVAAAILLIFFLRRESQYK